MTLLGHDIHVAPLLVFLKPLNRSVTDFHSALLAWLAWLAWLCSACSTLGAEDLLQPNRERATNNVALVSLLEIIFFAESSDGTV